MATITSEMVTEYFSQMNLRNAPFMYLDEFVIPYHTNTVDAKRWLAKVDRVSNVPVGTQMFEMSWGDYYKFTMAQTFQKIDWTWWNTHYHRDWNAFLESNIELAGM